MKHNNLYSHVEVVIGTNTDDPQKFNVIADTGSNWLVIPSCECVRLGTCSGRCFTGTDHSETFKIPPYEEMQALQLSYGSGDITAVLSTDFIQIGKIRAEMKNGLLLMIQQKLDFYDESTRFEGVLGLGTPRSGNAKIDIAQPFHTFIENSSNMFPHVDFDTGTDIGAYTDGIVDTKMSHQEKSTHIPTFLEAAQIDRFSICFLEGGTGKLVLDLPSLESTAIFKSIGKYHWGLGLNGISLGKYNANSNIILCDPVNKAENQNTPCGAIPDSGTSLMTGPKKQILQLFSEICENWEICKTKYHSLKSEKIAVKKDVLFQKLVMECNNLDTLPDINFHLAGIEGNTQLFAMSSADYILETVQPVVKTVKEWILDIFPVEMEVETGETQKVCVPAFSAFEYKTKLNGPVWILGAQFFFKYVLSYDMRANTIGISDAACACPTSKKSLVSISERREKNRSLRKIYDSPRFPRINVNVPL